jgi:hypothetical protein
MNTAPKFDPYPLGGTPNYSRWLASGAVLLVLVLVSSDAVPLPSGTLADQRLRLVLVAGVSVLWLLALLVRMLFYRFNRHNAQCYAETAQQLQHVWWAHHRQKVALIEAVLVGGACSNPEQRQHLFSPDHQPPTPASTPEGATIRLLQVFGDDDAERERQLAMLLVLQWQAQRPEPVAMQPLACYWQGSLTTWQAFVEQMAKCFPDVRLPAEPERWEGIRSLNAIIDRLQGAPAEARILCAGCQSSPTRAESLLPAGEAALLWLLGPEGGVRFSRGEWFDADTEHLPTVAERALQQGQLKAPPQYCVSFSPPDVPGLSAHGWNTSQYRQDANFGALGSLEAMVVQTLAAAYADQHQVPCAWLANDPHHTLALGIVEPDDSTS